MIDFMTDFRLLEAMTLRDVENFSRYEAAIGDSRPIAGDECSGRLSAALERLPARGKAALVALQGMISIGRARRRRRVKPVLYVVPGAASLRPHLRRRVP